MFCVVPSLTCPHPRAIKPKAPIMYHTIDCARKSAIGVESKDHRMDIHGQLHKAGATELIPKFECGHRSTALLNIKAITNTSSAVKKDFQ